MSPAAYASPLVLEPGVSRYLFLYLIAIHVMALAVLVTPLNVSVPVRLVLGVLVGSSFIWQWRRLRANNPSRIVRLIWEADDDWTLVCHDTTELVGRLRPETYETTWLVILRWQLQLGGIRSMVILPDMLDRQSFRRLRVRLRQARLADTVEDSGR